MRFSHLDASKITDTGKQRTNNEDAALSLPGRGLFCVADGMGGAADGELASRAVVDAVEEAFSGRHSDGEPDFERTKQLVREAALNANAWIREHAESRGSGGMGSTAVVLAFDPREPKRAAVMHAGDSRAYRLRGETLTRLTKDHSLVSEAGLDDRESLGPMFSSLVTRAVGIRARVDLEEAEVDVAENDLFLLCSDGLTTMVPDDVLVRILSENRNLDAGSICRLLVEESNRRGGVDNITALVVRVGSLPEAGGLEAMADAAREAGVAPVAEDRETSAREITGPEEQDTTPHSDSGAGLDAVGRELSAPTSDLECVTPGEAKLEQTTERSAGPRGEPAQDVRTALPAPGPSASGLWIAALVFGLGTVVVVWLLVGPPAPRGAASVPRKEAPNSLARTAPDETVPVVHTTPPSPGIPRLSERDILSLRAALPARMEGTLQTGEWGAMSGYVRKWTPAVPDLLAKSGKGPLYASWLGLWARIRDGEADAGSICRQYREEVTALCEKAGFDPPPEGADANAAAPAENRADMTCRLMYRLQKHLADSVHGAVRRCETEMEVFGPEPSRALADLWTFTGESDETVPQPECLARAGRIAGDMDRLDKWLNACGDSQIPLTSIRMVPATIVPRLLQDVREQHEAVVKRLEMVPARVGSYRLRQEEKLTPSLDRIDRLYQEALEGQRASEANVWVGTESVETLRALFDEIRNAVKIAGE